jgi:hypothetical protein
VTITEAELRLAADQLRRTADGFATAADRHQHVLTELTRVTGDLPELWSSPTATRVTAAGARLADALRPVPGHYREAADELGKLAAVADRLGDEVAGHAAVARAALTMADDAAAAGRRAELRADDGTVRRAEQERAGATRRHDEVQRELDGCATVWTAACRLAATRLGATAAAVRATVRDVAAPQADVELGPLDPRGAPPPEPVDVVGTVETVIGRVSSVATAEWLTRSSFAGLRVTAVDLLTSRAARAGARSSDPFARVALARANRDRVAAAASRRDATIAAGPRSLARGLRGLAAGSPAIARWSAPLQDLTTHAPRLTGAAHLAGAAAGHLGTGIAFRETVVAAREGDTEGVVTNGLSTTGGVMMGGGFAVAKTAGTGAMLTAAGVTFAPVVVVGAGLVVGAAVYENREAIVRIAGDTGRTINRHVGETGRAVADAGRAVRRTAGEATRAVGRSASAAVDGARRSLRDARSFASRTLGKALG